VLLCTGSAGCDASSMACASVMLAPPVVIMRQEYCNSNEPPHASVAHVHICAHLYVRRAHTHLYYLFHILTVQSGRMISSIAQLCSAFLQHFVGRYTPVTVGRVAIESGLISACHGQPVQVRVTTAPHSPRQRGCIIPV
jgi:hypothetical protein